ncbi:MAG: large repetitive protein, partial [Actinomycetota bacterium]
NPAGAGGSGVASITYWVDAGSHTTVSASTAAPSVAGDGAHVVSFFATDNVGNAGSTQTQSVTIDTVAPASPSVPDLASGSDSGTSSADNLTNVTTPTFVGTAEAGSTVTIFDGATSVGSGTATGGNYSITTSNLSAGARSITAKATDAASNTSSASAALTVTVDTTAPSAPSVPDLAAGSDSGSSNTDNITSSVTPTFAGTAETGATVAILNGGSPVGTGVATGGNYSIATSTLASGARVITATATDAAGNTSSASASLTVTIDTTAPVVGTTVIAKTVGYLAGSIKQGGTFYVYANITDATSITSATANNATLLSSGGTAVTLTAGSFSVGGVNYGYRSASQTANATLTAGAYTYAITPTDVAGNAATQSSLPVTVDNTVPFASDIQTTNGGTAGRADQGDTIVFTYSETIDPQSILAGWTGASTNVVVRLIDGGCVIFVVCGNDSFEVWDGTTAILPLTTAAGVNLGRADYNGTAVLGTDPDLTFASTMVKSGSTITITIGTLTAGTPDTAGGSGDMVWAPSASAYDAAGNAVSTATKNETGTSDKDF